MKLDVYRKLFQVCRSKQIGFVFQQALHSKKPKESVSFSQEWKCSSSLVFTVAAVCVRNNSSISVALRRIDTVHRKFAVHLEKIRYTHLIPIAGPMRKPKYVESPRVPGEAALPLRKGSEQGQPSQNGESLFSDTLFGRTAVHFRQSDTKEPA